MGALQDLLQENRSAVVAKASAAVAELSKAFGGGFRRHAQSVLPVLVQVAAGPRAHGAAAAACVEALQTTLRHTPVPGFGTTLARICRDGRGVGSLRVCASAALTVVRHWPAAALRKQLPQLRAALAQLLGCSDSRARSDAIAVAKILRDDWPGECEALLADVPPSSRHRYAQLLATAPQQARGAQSGALVVGGGRCEPPAGVATEQLAPAPAGQPAAQLQAKRRAVCRTSTPPAASGLQPPPAAASPQPLKAPRTAPAAVPAPMSEQQAATRTPAPATAAAAPASGHVHVQRCSVLQGAPEAERSSPLLTRAVIPRSSRRSSRSRGACTCPPPPPIVPLPPDLLSTRLLSSVAAMAHVDQPSHHPRRPSLVPLSVTHR